MEDDATSKRSLRPKNSFLTFRTNSILNKESEQNKQRLSKMLRKRKTIYEIQIQNDRPETDLSVADSIDIDFESSETEFKGGKTTISFGKGRKISKRLKSNAIRTHK